MAFCQCNFFSPTLCFGTDLNVFIPTPNSDELLNQKNSDYFTDGVRFPVLYLLHGGYGDYTDWGRLTSVERYAQEHKLAVVMPSASNSFYQNMRYGSNYLDYLLDEVPRFVNKMFPVSQKREHTYVAGLSMGGYGAVKLALERPEKFAAAISLSGALDVEALTAAVRGGGLKAPFDLENIINLENADLFQLAKKRMGEGKALPRIFVSCGTEDFVYPINQSALKKFQEAGVPVTYEEHPGIHDWDYWDTHIQRGLQWLGLSDRPVAE